jgi:hypothetical protein
MIFFFVVCLTTGPRPLPNRPNRPETLDTEPEEEVDTEGFMSMKNSMTPFGIELVT